MIRYALKCAKGHSFESWFRSASAFDSLLATGHVCCPECGSSDVEKALMAPQVRPARSAAAGADQADTQARPAPGPARAPGPLSTPGDQRTEKLAELRRYVEENSEYVGMKFASEARRIHSGDAPERAIHGEARLEDARALLDDGVPVAALPFVPARKSN